MKKYRVTCIKDSRLSIKPQMSILTEQLITTDGTDFNYEVPAGFIVVQLIEILPDLHIVTQKQEREIRR